MTFLQYIGGKLEAGNAQCFEVKNPANDEIVATVKAADLQQTENALQSAQAAYRQWARTPLRERLKYFDALLAALDENKEVIQSLLSQEVGKPKAQAVGEWHVFRGVVDAFRDEATHVYGEIMPDHESVPGTAYFYLQKRPIGVVVAHLAWNFPLLNVGLKMAPAILSGCPCIIKPSSKSPLSALFIGSLCEKVGFPAGTVNIISGASSVIGKALNESKIPRMIGLIGSTQTGRQIMAEGATSIKKYSLELGGNAPAIILKDADIKLAGDYILSRKFGTFAGQACGTINRIYVHKEVHRQFVDYCAAEIKNWSLGWGEGYEGQKVMGPVIGYAEQAKMQGLVEDATALGAEIIFGGKIPADKKKGSYFEATMLDNVPPQARVQHEEIFGPILPVSEFEDLDEVLELANDTDYGLNSYVFGQNTKEVFRCAELLEHGQVYINGAAKRDYHPHFGIKQSGLGSDYGKYSLSEYYEWKKIAFQP